jgi:branched-chain amino acid transport system ATP-binding protein
MTALEISGVEKSYGGFRALGSVRLRVGPGESVAVVGPNGAGKSTLFAVIGGQLRPDRGSVLLHGRNVTTRSPVAHSRAGLSRTFQVARLFTSSSVRECLVLAVSVRYGRRWVLSDPLRNKTLLRLAADALATVRLQSSEQRPVRSLTQGERKRLELAMAIAQSANVLLLDEPTAGLGPEEVETVVSVLQDIRMANPELAMLFSSHDMTVVSRLADRVIVMNEGLILAEGSPAEVAVDQRVIEIYLGSRR